MTDRIYTVLQTAEQADEYVTDQYIEETLGWFEDKRGVPTEDFIDRLCDEQGAYADQPYDLDNYDNDAARRILSRARRIKREQRS
jgi:hypothetical protein